MTTRRLRNRYDRPSAEPEAVSVRSVSPFPAPPATETEPAPAPEAPNGPATEATAAPAVKVEPGGEAPTPKRHARRRFGFLFMMTLALIAFVTGLLVFNNLVMPRLIHGIGEVEVPDVRNLTLDQAEQALRPLNLQ